MLHRRALLAASLAAPAIVRAQSLRKVSLMLAWLPEGSYGFSFVSRARGFWEKRGLDVQIVRGFGSLAAAQAVAAGQFTFGMVNPSTLVLLAAKGQILRQIGLIDYDPFMGVAVLADSPIRGPKDFEHRKIGQTFSSSDAAFFPVFAQRNGVDLGMLERVNLDAKMRNQSLSTRQVDAVTGLASSIIPTLGVAGVKTRMFLYGDYGVSIYGNLGVTALPETVGKDSAMCQDFLDGLCEGVVEVLARPDAALDSYLSQVPEMKLGANGPATARASMAVMRAGVLATNDAVEHGLGWADPGKLSSMADLVMQYQAELGSTRPNLDQLFGNEFAGRIKPSAAEWDIARGLASATLAAIRGS